MAAAKAAQTTLRDAENFMYGTRDRRHRVPASPQDLVSGAPRVTHAAPPRRWPVSGLADVSCASFPPAGRPAVDAAHKAKPAGDNALKLHPHTVAGQLRLDPFRWNASS